LPKHWALQLSQQNVENCTRTIPATKLLMLRLGTTTALFPAAACQKDAAGGQDELQALGWRRQGDARAAAEWQEHLAAAVLGEPSAACAVDVRLEGDASARIVRAEPGAKSPVSVSTWNREELRKLAGAAAAACAAVACAAVAATAAGHKNAAVDADRKHVAADIVAVVEAAVDDAAAAAADAAVVDVADAVDAADAAAGSWLQLDADAEDESAAATAPSTQAAPVPWRHEPLPAPSSPCSPAHPVCPPLPMRHCRLQATCALQLPVFSRPGPLVSVQQKHAEATMRKQQTLAAISCSSSLNSCYKRWIKWNQEKHRNEKEKKANTR
jgi:hypothetical protein